MIIVGFYILNIFEKSSFFLKKILLANNSIEIILGIFFLNLNNTNILFVYLNLFESFIFLPKSY